MSLFAIIWFVWLAAGAYGLTVAGANLNEYPSPAQEPNDYGEKHRTS